MEREWNLSNSFYKFNITFITIPEKKEKREKIVV